MSCLGVRGGRGTSSGEEQRRTALATRTDIANTQGEYNPALTFVKYKIVVSCYRAFSLHPRYSEEPTATPGNLWRCGVYSQRRSGIQQHNEERPTAAAACQGRSYRLRPPRFTDCPPLPRKRGVVVGSTTDCVQRNFKLETVFLTRKDCVFNQTFFKAFFLDLHRKWRAPDCPLLKLKY